jgi:hypothetical protein
VLFILGPSLNITERLPLNLVACALFFIGGLV